MRIVALPGVFHPISDSRLLAARACATASPGARVLELCTGSGAVAVALARCGAAAVTAVDRSWRATLTVRLNARRNGVSVRARRGDLFDAVPGERFDLVVANPPYVPARDAALPLRGPGRATDAGHDGRVLLDRICAQAADHLTPGGALLVVHSSVIGGEETLERLRSGGLEASVTDRRPGPLGPLMRARRELLERRGLLEPGADHEELLVICGRRVPVGVQDREPAPAGATARG